MDHHFHHQHHNSPAQILPEKRISEPSGFRLAFSATVHCLLGCGLGEIAGVIIGTMLGWANMPTMLLAILLGFVFGFLLGMRPLLQAGFSLKKAFRTVLIAEGLSIAVMETAEALTEIYTPGVMQAGLDDGIFWLGMLFALTMGFVAAFPVNIWLIKRGVRHQH